MTTVPTRHITTSATDTLVSIYLGIDYRIAVEIGRRDKVRKLFAYDIFKMFDASITKVCLESQDEVVDDAIAVLHNGSTYLDITTT